MFHTLSGTTASTSTVLKRIGIDIFSNGRALGRTGTSKQRCRTASLTLSKTLHGPILPSISHRRSTSNHATISRPRSTPGPSTNARGASSSRRVAGRRSSGLQAIADAGVSALVVTPTIDLMNQWHATLTNAFGDQLPEPIGVLGGGNHDVTAITVTTYDSAYRYVNEYGDRFGLLVVDEEHHLPAPTYQQIPEMMIAPYRLGLTATYERPDGKHELLEDLLGPVVYREHVDELAGEYLSEYETIHMSVELTADERETYNEEYQIYRDYVDSHDFDLWKERGYQEFLKRTSYDPQGRRALIAKQRAERLARTATKKLDTLDNLIKRHHDDRAIIFTANNDFAYDISQEFIVPCITHQTKTDKRTEILERFRTGEYSMLVTSQVLDEGIDVPAANVGIILSGSASKRQYAQRLGRILRLTDDRQPARLYEIIAEDTMETYVSQRRREGVNA